MRPETQFYPIDHTGSGESPLGVQLYNTLTRKKEPFEPLEEGRVKMYVCGVTVYDHCHLGHARAAIVFDVIHRYFEYRGYDVLFVCNFTDVDDKIIATGQAPQGFGRGGYSASSTSANPSTTWTLRSASSCADARRTRAASDYFHRPHYRL